MGGGGLQEGRGEETKWVKRKNKTKGDTFMS